ncbi:GGDEF domain-containing protein [Catelliglobosispora koreensis]|uniref:GGDEF domain-containing protein n=1 Tax=Catelliglobosispora koreensis TaxID=129052 RepID=UPI001FE1E049|nr:GGDEF domain-containing protein [Catelliglobosispora koreensis]
MSLVVIAVCAVVEGISLAATGIALWRLSRRVHAMRAASRLDPLTKILGRDGLLDRIADLNAAGQAPGVLLLDLGRFKSVNDAWGHDAGDDLLIAVAHRLNAVAARLGGHAGRLGGDEYIVLLPGEPSDATLAEACEQIQQALARPFRLESVAVAVRVSVTVGAAAAQAKPLPGKPFRAADIALYHARHHRQPVAIYQPGMVHPNAQQRHGERLRDLRQAPPVAVFDSSLFTRVAASEVSSDTAHPDDSAELAELIDLIDPRGRKFGTDIQDLARRCVDHGILQLADAIKDIHVEPTVLGDTRDGGFRVLTVLAAGPVLASPQIQPRPFTDFAEPADVAIAVMTAIADTITSCWDLYRAAMTGAVR